MRLATCHPLARSPCVLQVPNCVYPTPRTMDKVDDTIARIQEQTTLAHEIADAMTSIQVGEPLDDVRL